MAFYWTVPADLVDELTVWRSSRLQSFGDKLKCTGLMELTYEPGSGLIENYTCLNFSLISMSINYENNSVKIGLVHYCRSLGYLSSV